MLLRRRRADPADDTATYALAGLGFDMEHYHQESFNAPIQTESEQADLNDVIPEEDASSELIFSLAYAVIRAQSQAKGVNLSNMDMLIGAHAVAVNAKLVTDDGAFNHFKEWITTENWIAK